MSHATHLEAAIDGTRLAHDTLQTVHEGRPLLVRYDLDAVRNSVDRDALRERPATLWRYRELLPVEDEAQIVSLGEGMTPLLRCERLGSQLGLDQLYVKDESVLPTGSFKSRGMTMAVTRARELGAKRLAVPTAGNAGGALAAYAARAGLEAFIFMPADTPVINQAEARLYGAHAFVVDGLINDCGAIVRAGTETMEWFDLSTLKEPYRLEGKKTMGLELAEDLGWTLPDVILYPTGGGTGLIGMWKAFAELRELGWLESDDRPRMYACQSEGCAPIVTAFETGTKHADPFPNAHTLASGLRVPVAVGDFLILDAVRESGGEARASSEEDLHAWMRRASATEGISICPETGACFATLEALIAEGKVKKSDRVVVFNTGAAQKYLEVLDPELPPVPYADKEAGEVDWERLHTQ